MKPKQFLKKSILTSLFAGFILIALGFSSISCKNEGFACTCDPEPTGPKVYENPKLADIQMYEVNLRAFSEDGNFQGVIDRLDSIKNLGMNVIWLMPIQPIGVEKRSFGLGSPYSISDYRGINPEFGNLTIFKKLITEAHNRGISVIIDWVANHTAWDHAWVKAQPDWYTQDANGNIVIPEGTNWTDVADLNYSNQEMRKAMITSMRYWGEEVGVDGFRCDAANMIPDDFWKQAIDSLKAHRSIINPYVLLAEGDRPQQLMAGFQMNYAWSAYTTVKNVMAGSPATQLVSAIMAEDGAIPAGCRKLRFTTNHDESAWEKTPIQLFGSQQAANAAFVAVTCASGNPLVYSSQEVGREALLPFFTKDPINWFANKATYKAYKQYLTIRDTSTVLKNGTVSQFSDANVVCVKRTYGNHQMLVAVNMRNKVSSFTTPPDWVNKTTTNIITETTIALPATINLEPYQYLILK